VSTQANIQAETYGGGEPYWLNRVEREAIRRGLSIFGHELQGITMDAHERGALRRAWADAGIGFDELMELAGRLDEARGEARLRRARRQLTAARLAEEGSRQAADLPPARDAVVAGGTSNREHAPAAGTLAADPFAPGAAEDVPRVGGDTATAPPGTPPSGPRDGHRIGFRRFA
jgi:hypothetical protein